MQFSVRLFLYPNPSSNHFYIKGIDHQEVIDVLVTDNVWKVVLQKSLSQPYYVETKDWSAGVYSLLVLDKRGNSLALKWVKN